MKDSKTPENSEKDDKDIKKELGESSSPESLKETLTGVFQSLKALTHQDFETVEAAREPQTPEKSSSGAGTSKASKDGAKDQGTNSSMGDLALKREGPDKPNNPDERQESPKGAQKSEKGDSTKNQEDKLIPFKEQLKNLSDLQSLKEQKSNIIRIIAAIIGILFIISGLIYSVLGSPVSVSSNVIFGERATFSAFMVLIGFLILAGVFARKLLEITFLKRIYSELQIAEGKAQKDEDDKQTRTDKGKVKKNYKKD